MASSVPPVKGTAFTFDVALVSQADTDIFKTTVTLAAGDVLVSKDGAAFANIASLPTELTKAGPANVGVLAVALTADEMNADRVTVLFHDAAGDEWQDAQVTIYTAAQTLDTTDGVADSILADTGTDGVVLANDAITAAKIAANAIGASELAADAAAEIAAAAWAYATRTLTSTAAATVSAVTGSTLNLAMTATYSGELSGLTIPATWTKIWWTCKRDPEADADAEALLQLVESNPGAGTDGVLYVAGAAATGAQQALGSLTVDQAAGTVVIALDEALTAALSVGAGLRYDVKCLESGGAATILTEGDALIARTVTRAYA